jgi:uncharacterized Zn finger protein (UPF0148 family)
VITVSGVCVCAKCEGRTRDIYRMVGTCLNCGTGDILMLFRAGDKAGVLDCPVCGVWRSVRPNRLATDDEIPAAEAQVQKMETKEDGK